MTTTPRQGAPTPYGDPLEVTNTPQVRDAPGRPDSPPAKEQAKAQARDLVHEARTQVSEHSRTQRDRIIQALDQAADELRSMADSGGGREGVATEVVRQVATRAQDLSSFLGRHEPGEMVTEVRRFARRRPGAFLLGAVIAGALAGRMAKGATNSPSHRDDGTSRALAGGESVPTTMRLDQYETFSSPGTGYGESAASGGRL